MSKCNSLLQNFVKEEIVEKEPVRQVETVVETRSEINVYDGGFESKRTAGRRPSPVAKGRSKHQITTVLFGDNYQYVMERGAELGYRGTELCSYINLLIDKDRRRHGK